MPEDVRNDLKSADKPRDLSSDQRERVTKTSGFAPMKPKTRSKAVKTVLRETYSVFGAFSPSSRCLFFVLPSVTLSINTAIIKLKMPMVTSRHLSMAFTSCGSMLLSESWAIRDTKRWSKM